jgi:predicted RNA polymerase sigma factor
LTNRIGAAGTAGTCAWGERCLAAGHNAAGPGRPAGSYLLQAEIAARHARAPTFAETDWDAIERLYAAAS